MLRRIFTAGALAASLFALGCASEVGNDGDRVGGPCVVSGECAFDSRCETGESWPGGYCAQACDSDADCPDGSQCTERGQICVVSCGSDDECRSDEGYACQELPARGAGGTFTGCVAAE
jgi:hypothetical protein